MEEIIEVTMEVGLVEVIVLITCGIKKVCVVGTRKKK